MRDISEKDKIDLFMRTAGTRLRRQIDIFFTGGATAVLIGWRKTTVDIDIKFIPENAEMFSLLSSLKEELNINIELASPEDFIPRLPQWRERCLFIKQEGKAGFFHYDPYSQFLSKIERGWKQDLDDAEEIFMRFLEEETIIRLFNEIKQDIKKYPRIDEKQFLNKLQEFLILVKHKSNE